MKQLRTYFETTLERMIHPPMGILQHTFITPSAITDLTLDRQSGGYGQQYDWDLFFIGVALSKTRPDLMRHFKDALMNFIDFVNPDGHTPRVLSPYRFYDPYDHHKPFLAQGVALAAESLQDYGWVTDTVWTQLERYLHYWENRRGFHSLIRWKSAMESGVDNNATTVNMDDYSAESVDASTYVYLELRSMAKLAEKTGRDPAYWNKKSELIAHSLNAIMWNEANGTYYDVLNFSDANVEYIAVDAWTNFVPLYAGIPSRKQADTIIKRYILNPDAFLGKHGIRSLSYADPRYNTAKRFEIYLHAEKRRWTVSNWQGPVWIVANWMILEGMERYGYKTEAQKIREVILKTLDKDLSKTGTLHENYNPETGEGLWAENFGSWNLLAWSWL